jgi:hypothetical protein
MSFTPGPWRVRCHKNYGDDTPFYEIAAGKEERHINKGQFHPDNAIYFTDEFTVVQCGMDRDYNTYEAGIANIEDANLIAAAPELYEQLKNALSIIDCYEQGAHVEAMRQAIAKAEGR